MANVRVGSKCPLRKAQHLYILYYLSIYLSIYIYIYIHISFSFFTLYHLIFYNIFIYFDPRLPLLGPLEAHPEPPAEVDVLSLLQLLRTKGMQPRPLTPWPQLGVSYLILGSL